MRIKRILCGVDFSQESVAAFEAAVTMAKAFNAGLHILHVIEAYPVSPRLLPLSGIDEAIEAIEVKAAAAMQALIEPSRSALEGIAVTTEITSGRAFTEILRCARERKVDLIILGAKGVGLVEDMVFGSTVERVTKAATCSVFVARG
ncbi:MAG TPA: universal stress protein [Blastocatellia bacterium]|nr:universal stress protein [Blastocatellia bacterium]